MSESAMSEESTIVEETIVRPKRRRRVDDSKKPRKQPRYNVILWDDDDHTYGYVIYMLQELFAYPPEMGYQLARQVDTAGRCICLTTTKEHAELKRDQIHAFGKDELMENCAGSMSATIEPVPE